MDSTPVIGEPPEDCGIEKLPGADVVPAEVLPAPEPASELIPEPKLIPEPELNPEFELIPEPPPLPPKLASARCRTTDEPPVATYPTGAKFPLLAIANGTGWTLDGIADWGADDEEPFVPLPTALPNAIGWEIGGARVIVISCGTTAKVTGGGAGAKTSTSRLNRSTTIGIALQ
jgi:hypothetical protein